MREYTIVARETVSGTFYIRANSKAEAMEKFGKLTADGGYRDMMEDVDNFTTEVIEETILDGEDFETGYIPEMDMTVIVKYIYRNGSPVVEQIVGYYHGEPDDAMTEQYKNNGVVGIMA